MESGTIVALPGGDVWTDYDGDSAYGDFEVTPGNPPTVTNRRSYEPGLAQVDPWMSSGGTATDYVMSDHLGTTRGLTMPNGTGVEPVVYTAFGERISGTNHRFGYVGSWGYQSHGEFEFLHVGARYYDPVTGRFLQRDPIGIRGGTNVYAYAFNRPTVGIDPYGHSFWGAVGGAIGGAIGGFITGAISGVGLPGAIAGAIAGGISGAVSGGLDGGGFGGGFVTGGINGAVAGIGGGIVGGLTGAGASTATIVAGGIIGGGISGGTAAAINGGSRNQVIGGTVVGGISGGLGGVAGEAGEKILGCLFAADAETIGAGIGRLR